MNTFKQIKNLMEKCDKEFKDIINIFNEENDLDLLITVHFQCDEISVTVHAGSHAPMRIVKVNLEKKDINIKWSIKEDQRDFYNNLITDILENDCFNLNEKDEIKYLECNIKTNNILKANGINTISELKKYSHHELLKMQHLGQETMNIVANSVMNFDGTVLSKYKVEKPSKEEVLEIVEQEEKSTTQRLDEMEKESDKLTIKIKNKTVKALTSINKKYLNRITLEETIETIAENFERDRKELCRLRQDNYLLEQKNKELEKKYKEITEDVNF